ncbi:MAG: cell division protein FtsA [Candidatus Omnitrophica bacterium]|nr:cell division protein FtsA [Candidatus Omnitrophota bacterium]
MNPDIVCGVDIGSSSIRALIAHGVDSHIRLKERAQKTPPIHVKEKILGFSSSPTKGFSKGLVSNLNLLSDAIQDAVSNAESLAHCRVRKLITNISGVQVRTFKSRGSINISDRPSEITKDDITRCIESAKLIAMSLDREIIHLSPERFFIDDKIEIEEPLGLFSSKLDVDLNIITTLVNILQNLTKAVNLAGYEVEDVILSGAGTALAIFDRKELEEDAVIIDVGKDLAEVVLFIDGKLRDCFYFPFGSDELTQVLQEKLGIMFEEAEELRMKHGIVAKAIEDLYDTSPIVIPSLRNRIGSVYSDTQSEERVGVISRRQISDLLFPKVEEIMQDVYKKIQPYLKTKKRIPHISVVGGVSRMDGFVEAIEDIFCVPIDMAKIVNTKDLQDTSFACCLGLARYGILKKLEKNSRSIFNTNSFTGRILSKARFFLSEYF